MCRLIISYRFYRESFGDIYLVLTFGAALPTFIGSFGRIDEVNYHVAEGVAKILKFQCDDHPIGDLQRATSFAFI